MARHCPRCTQPTTCEVHGCAAGLIEPMPWLRGITKLQEPNMRDPDLVTVEPDTTDIGVVPLPPLPSAETDLLRGYRAGLMQACLVMERLDAKGAARLRHELRAAEAPSAQTPSQHMTRDEVCADLLATIADFAERTNQLYPEDRATIRDVAERLRTAPCLRDQ